MQTVAKIKKSQFKVKIFYNLLRDAKFEKIYSWLRSSSIFLKTLVFLGVKSYYGVRGIINIIDRNIF